MLVGVLERNYQYRHKLIVHTHLPLALKHGITKVHLPESYIYNTAFNRLIDDDEALIDSLRFMIPNLNQKLVSKLEVSYSLHPKEGSFDEETQMAIEKKAKFFLVSPVKMTTCKPDVIPLNEDLVNQLHQFYSEKMVLLGGLDMDSIESYKSKGFHSFALRSGIESFI